MPASGRPRALITGLSGQDGSLLADLLLAEGYEVAGMVHGDPAGPLGAAEHLRDRVQLVRGELLEPESLTSAVAELRPDELYHLAAPSFVPDSWERPAMTVQAIAGATATLLEAVRAQSPATRTCVAVSGTMFGSVSESPQREDTPCRPRNPYSAAKLAAHLLAGQLRAHDGIHVCSAILYNHESDRRPESFVSRKITRGAAAVKLGLEDSIVLGDLEAVRDWSYAGDIVRGMWLMLRHDRPDDYILASGVGHTVAELAEIAFGHLGLDAREHIRVDQSLVRPPDPVPLVGDPRHARETLGWRPTLGFEELIRSMVDADLLVLQGPA